MDKIEFILYYRNGCHLCEQMAAELYPLSDDWNFTLVDIDIDESPTLINYYNADVPVLAKRNGTDVSDDVIIFKHFFDHDKLLKALQEQNGSS